MGGYAPHTREGLIALIAMRRIKAEKIRRQKLAEANTPGEAKALEQAGRKETRSGWFRR
jgi:hypothetical protein